MAGMPIPSTVRRLGMSMKQILIFQLTKPVIIVRMRLISNHSCYEENSNFDPLFTESSWLVERGNNDLNEKDSELLHGSEKRGYLRDAATGSPVTKDRV
ncbi:hypothetical protein D3C75_775250 [compost metagenome]